MTEPAGPRVPLVPADSDDPTLSPIFGLFRDAGREVPTLYRALGNAPAMLKAWTDFAWPLRLEATSPRGLRELSIMRVAQLTGAAYEWLAHRPAALKFGVTEEQLDALASWRDAECFTPAERALLEVTDQMTADIEGTETALAALGEHFPTGEVVELVLTVAFYACVSRTLRTLGIVPDDPPNRA